MSYHIPAAEYIGVDPLDTFKTFPGTNNPNYLVKIDVMQIAGITTQSISKIDCGPKTDEAYWGTLQLEPGYTDQQIDACKHLSEVLFLSSEDIYKWTDNDWQSILKYMCAISAPKPTEVVFSTKQTQGRDYPEFWATWYLTNELKLGWQYYTCHFYLPPGICHTGMSPEITEQAQEIIAELKLAADPREWSASDKQNFVQLYKKKFPTWQKDGTWSTTNSDGE